MLADLFALGGVVVAVVAALEVTARFDRVPRRELRSEWAVREAMLGPEGGAVRAEFRRSGICPPERPRPAGFR